MSAAPAPLESAPAAAAAAAAAAAEPEFCEARHVAFIRGLMDKRDSFEHVVMEHLKVGVG
jgi:2-keto-3-deoxy-galactonokinase